LSGGLIVVRERDVEKYLREKVKAAGGRAYKWESPGNNGVPDRIILFPGNITVFVELKAPGRKPTALQKAQHAKIQATGHTVLIIDSKQSADEFIQRYRGVD
jgi:hypothetical protein